MSDLREASQGLFPSPAAHTSLEAAEGGRGLSCPPVSLARAYRGCEIPAYQIGSKGNLRPSLGHMFIFLVFLTALGFSVPPLPPSQGLSLPSRAWFCQAAQVPCRVPLQPLLTQAPGSVSAVLVFLPHILELQIQPSQTSPSS